MADHGQINDPAWIREALDRYESQLTGYALRLLRDVELARDVVQDTFLRLCRENPADLDGHLAEWLFTVCRNRAFDVRRKEGRMSTMADPGAATPTESRGLSPADAVEQQDTADHVTELIGELPENQQEVLRLKFHNGMTYREIAGITGLTVSNVGFLIHRGLTTLRYRLKRQFAG